MPINYNKGFTMLQLVIGIVIMATSLGGIITLNLTNNSKFIENRNYFIATVAASNVINTIKEPEYFRKYEKKGILINKENSEGFELSKYFLEDLLGQIKVGFSQSDNNFILIEVEVDYVNAHGRSVKSLFNSGVYIDVY